MSTRVALFVYLALCAAAPVSAQQAPIQIGAILQLTRSGASYDVWMNGGTEIAHSPASLRTPGGLLAPDAVQKSGATGRDAGGARPISFKIDLVMGAMFRLPPL